MKKLLAQLASLFEPCMNNTEKAKSKIKLWPVFLFLAAGYLLFFVSPVSGQPPFPLPEIIYSEESLVCTDFVIEYSQTSETKISLTPTPTGAVQGITSNEEEVTGTLRLEAENLPDFSRADKNFLLVLERLLPADLKKGLLIDQTPLKTKTSHYVIGKDSDGKETEAETIPETEISFPSWWTSILGGSKILCGLLNTCQPPKSLAIKVEQPNLTSPSQNTLCLAGNQPKTDPVLGIDTLKEEFKTRSLWQKITEIIDDLINWIRRTVTKKETELANKTRGYLPGGETFNQQSSFMDSFLPAGFIPADKNAPLGGEARYQLSEGYQAQAGAEKVNYQNLGKARARYCLQLCSLYPAGTNISTIDPLCPSCSLKDYPLTSTPVSFLPVPPQSCSADAPYEIIPSCTICQDVLFCYGNNYRLCQIDPSVPGNCQSDGPGRWWCQPSLFPLGLILYNGENFPVPSGGVYVCDSNVYGCANQKCR